jgi:hypothetical protein
MDGNGNHVKDPGESGLENWVVYLDLNNDGVLDSGDVTKTTDSTGHYAFTGLAAGVYTVREALLPHFLQSLPAVGFYSVSLTSGQSAINIDFGNVPLATGP